jgi:formate dehydrogenase maturation protein FdhE
MTLNHKEKPIEEKKPRCPYCGARPCPIFIAVTQFGSAQAVVFSCATCEKILSVAPIEMPQPEQRREERLVVPV